MARFVQEAQVSADSEIKTDSQTNRDKRHPGVLPDVAVDACKCVMLGRIRAMHGNMTRSLEEPTI